MHLSEKVPNEVGGQPQSHPHQASSFPSDDIICSQRGVSELIWSNLLVSHTGKLVDGQTGRQIDRQAVTADGNSSMVVELRGQ